MAPIARRGFLARLAALPILGAGASFFARRAEAATTAVIAQIDAAERRCHDSVAAFVKAAAAYEAAVPQPHFTLLERGRWKITLEGERRKFDGEFVNRRVDCRGEPCLRSIATVRTLTYDLDHDWRDIPGRGKAIRRIRRRAARHEQHLREMEETFGLFPLHVAKDHARQDMEALAKAIFARPATTLAEIRVQALALLAVSRVLGESHASYWAARYGGALATNLDKLGAAA